MHQRCTNMTQILTRHLSIKALGTACSRAIIGMSAVYFYVGSFKTEETQPLPNNGLTGLI